MIELELDDKQLASLLKSLDNLDMEHMVDPVLETIGESVIAKVKPYPPVPAHSRYQRGTDPRSERLGDKWWYKLIYHGVTVGNAASYAGWVHGEEQVSFHKATGWKQLLKTAQDELGAILTKIEKQIDKIWRAQ